MQPRDLEMLTQELGQPADALGLLTHALRHRTAGGEPQVILDQMELALTQIRRQLASLLDVVRAERCRAEPEHVEFALMPLFVKLGLQSDRLARDNRVSLSIVPTKARVVGDPVAIEVILRNLVVNALFFARGGRVLVGCRRRGEMLQVQVWDNGVGILPQDQVIIFEPLQKLKGDGDDLTPGLGIGLTIARDLAQKLGHNIDVRSELSLGSVFSITLPQAERPGQTGV
jgi:signal transduction histidine kinase